VLLGVTSERLLSSQQPALSLADSTVQIASDEELARQLQQQMVFEQEHAQIMQQEQLRRAAGDDRSYPGQEALYPDSGYPGAAAYAAGGGYHPSVHRPSQWGAAGPPAAPSASDGSEGYGIGSGLYSASSAVASAVGSLWSWATTAEESEAAVGRGSATARQEGSRPDGDEAREMQTIRRGPRRDFCGPATMATAAGDEGTQDEQALYAAGSGSGRYRDGGGGVEHDTAEEVRVVHGAEGYAGGSGGEVRRRGRHATKAAEHHDIL